MKCCIIKDLLPGYVDGVNSEETDIEVKKHLQDCVTCRKVYEQMSAELRKKEMQGKREVDFLRNLKIIIRQRYAFGAFLICAFLIIVTGFLRSYDVPIAYDAEKMTVEVFQTSEYNPMQESDTDAIQSGNAEGREKEDGTDEIRLVLKECVRSDDLTSTGRTVERDGVKVRVVYYCYTRSLWNSLFHPGTDGFADSSVSTGAIYESSFFRESIKSYEPRMREIYYLPMGNMGRLDRLCDEEFEAQKENAVLVWSGVI